MLLFSRLSLASLIEICRTLRHNLGAGLSVVDVFRQLARKGPLSARPIAARVLYRVENGESLEDALEPEKAAFPPLFLSLTVVGERSGCLPEVFAELEKYFVLQQRLKRQFLGQIAWPAFQFLAAIFVIALMIWALGIVAELHPESPPIDPLGLGVGAFASIRWLLLAFGSLAALGLAYVLGTRLLKQKATIDYFLLSIPVIGPCLEALALQRFCLALRMTIETGMSITAAIRLSLRATGNAAFETKAEPVVATLRAGDDLTLALASSRLFPYDFRNIIAVGEEGGRLVEVLRHQADHYEEEAGRRMKTLTFVAGLGVWLVVAMLIIYVIFRIFTGAILPQYNVSGM